MKVLLVYPEFPDTFWSFKHALKFIRKRAGAPPLGLLTVAAMLPADWEPRLVDLNTQSLNDEDLAWADIAFVSAMIMQRDAARSLIERCKQAGLTVVAGGPPREPGAAGQPAPGDGARQGILPRRVPARHPGQGASPLLGAVDLNPVFGVPGCSLWQ